MGYEGLFLRDALGQKPNDPPPAAWQASPDIVVAGAAPVPDPATLVSPAGYNTPPSQTIAGPQLNFVYVRGVNTSSTANQARVWLYIVADSLKLWPEAWQSQGITVAARSRNYVDVAAAPGQTVATGLPFVIEFPMAREAFNLVALVENQPVSNPPSAPLPGHFADADALAAYVRDHPSVAWLDVTGTSVDSPSAQFQEQVSGPPEAGNYLIGFRCDRMPTDWDVAFSVAGPDAAGTAIYPRARLFASNACILLPVTWPASYESSMLLSLWTGTPGGRAVQAVMVPDPGKP